MADLPKRRVGFIRESQLLPHKKVLPDPTPPRAPLPNVEYQGFCECHNCENGWACDIRPKSGRVGHDPPGSY